MINVVHISARWWTFNISFIFRIIATWNLSKLQLRNNNLLGLSNAIICLIHQLLLTALTFAQSQVLELPLQWFGVFLELNEWFWNFWLVDGLAWTLDHDVRVGMGLLKFFLNQNSCHPLEYANRTNTSEFLLYLVVMVLSSGIRFRWIFVLTNRIALRDTVVVLIIRIILSVRINN